MTATLDLISFEEGIVLTHGGSAGRFTRRNLAVAESPRGGSLCRSRRGFTFVESVIAMTVIAIAGAALLTAVASAVTSCNDSVFQAVGRGLAQQLMDEIAARKFYNSTSASTLPTMRAYFTTIDDYSGYTETPPHAKGGDILGTEQSSATMSNAGMMWTTPGSSSSTSRPSALQVPTDFMNRFTRTVLVERVQPSTSGVWTVSTQNSLYRRVTVTVSYTVTANQTRPVAKVSRIFASVPPSP